MRFLFIYKKKSEKKAENCLFEFWRTLVRAVTYLSSDGAELSVRLFGQNKPFFCVCFVGNVADICMISICVDDNQL